MLVARERPDLELTCGSAVDVGRGRVAGFRVQMARTGGWYGRIFHARASRSVFWKVKQTSTTPALLTVTLIFYLVSF